MQELLLHCKVWLQLWQKKSKPQECALEWQSTGGKKKKKMLWNVVYLPLEIIQTLPYRSYRLSGQCHVLIYSFCCFVSNIIKAFLDSKTSSSWNNALMFAVLCVSLFTFLMIKVWGKGLQYAAYFWPCRVHLSTIWKSVRNGDKHSHLTHSNVRTQLFRQNHGILAKLDHQRYLKPTKVKKNAKLLFYLFLSGNAVAC